MPAAIFVHLDTVDRVMPYDDPCILRFPDRESAVQWAVKKLVEAGELYFDELYFEDTSPAWVWSGKWFRTAEEALEEWQYSLGLSEYFHVYDCHDIGIAESQQVTL